MNTPQHDVLRRFLFEDLGIRGLWVRLSESWQTAQANQHSAPEVQLQLGQALTAAVLLSSTIKFKGSLILQVQGDGPLRTLVAQATHDRCIRGLVKSTGEISMDSLASIYGNGQLVITLSPETAQPYQGVVPLQGKNLADVLETYFAQSEQLITRLWLFADAGRTTGLLLQELPGQMQERDDWERIVMLADTLTEREIQSLSCEDMLYRLFHQERLRLYDEEPVRFACSCSVPKIENALRMLGRNELESVLTEQGNIEVNCEFCNKHYRFDRIDVEHLLNLGMSASPVPQQRH